MMWPNHGSGKDEPAGIRARFGLPVELVRLMQSRDILVRLDLSDVEIRELLCEAHMESATLRDTP